MEVLFLKKLIVKLLTFDISIIQQNIYLVLFNRLANQISHHPDWLRLSSGCVAPQILLSGGLLQYGRLGQHMAQIAQPAFRATFLDDFWVHDVGG